MATADYYTQFIWKNGKYLSDDDMAKLPFKYDEYGCVTDILNLETNEYFSIKDKIEWHNFPHHAIYCRDGFSLTQRVTFKEISERIKWILHKKKCIGHARALGRLIEDEYCITTFFSDIYEYGVCIFWLGGDVYTLLGGYGNHKNVYCHFKWHNQYNKKGRSIELENQVAVEAYDWIQTEVAGAMQEMEENV